LSSVGQHEIRTQKSVIEFFKKSLGYTYLGHWKDRDGNSAIEEQYLTDWLKRQGHNDKIITKILFELNKAAALGGSKTLYNANREEHHGLAY
jgi:type I restriction enzyme, R subunit